MNKFERAYLKCLLNENIEEIDEFAPLATTGLIDNNLPFIDKIVSMAKAEGADEIIQIYIASDDETYENADIALITKCIMSDDPTDFDYIVMIFKKEGKKLTFVSDSDAGDTVQRMGYFTNFDFVRDRVLDNMLKTIGRPVSDWKLYVV